MCRITFGITCSPFLASKVLLQIAEDYSMEFPEATAVTRNAFYVDDCLTGAGTLEEADKLRQDLNFLLSHGCFTLRKWRSSSAELLERIPAELKEADGSDPAMSLSQCPKTLGVHWNTHSDMLYVCIPDLTHLQIPTKREVPSAVGKFFDVLGWFSPSTVQIKIILQLTWKEKLGWDDPLPASMIDSWTQWKEVLPLRSSHAIPRRLKSSSYSALEIQLHGFSDASQTAYGCVIYLRALHQDTSISVRIILAKTKVAPLAGATIPRLELCGALLLCSTPLNCCQRPQYSHRTLICLLWFLGCSRMD